VAINLVDSMLDDFTAKVDGRWSQARADNCMTFPVGPPAERAARRAAPHA
jgi:hypothetical protein